MPLILLAVVFSKLPPLVQLLIILRLRIVTVQVFFTVLLEYVGQLALKGSEGVKMIDKLSR